MADDRIEDLLGQLTVEEKASLTAGADVWHLPPIERLGIGSLKVSDGPSGVRGDRVGTRRSLAFPCGMAVGATWDVDLAHEYGIALGHEAISKHVHVLLGPTICIPRTPLAGRTFESLAEDPLLSARLATAYITGVQSTGVGCCAKHFACNDQEHERMTISAEVDERTLREIHLPAFEAAVGEAGVWTVMSAYNRLNGTYCGEHPWLLGELLKEEWAFDGFVVSDWFGTHSTADAANAGLDVEMPGRGSFLGPKLADAVAAGEVTEDVVDEHARRILRVVERAGLLDREPDADEAEEDDPDRRALARRLAVAGTVLLQNDGILPLDAATGGTVAVIGPNADLLESGGGGSSSVSQHRYPSLIDELRHRLGRRSVVFEQGCRLGGPLMPVDPRLIAPGLELAYHDGPDLAGEVLATDTLSKGYFIAMGNPLPGVRLRHVSFRASGQFVADVSGTWTLGIGNAGLGRLLLDGELIVDNTEPTPGGFFYGSGSKPKGAEVELVAGEHHELVVELIPQQGVRVAGFQLIATRPPVPDSLERAVAAAADADVALVVVGANAQSETEGADRGSLRLAGDQDELVRRVTAANPRTVVVVNAGAPVELPWADDVAAVLMAWYPGEEGAQALADIITGLAEPTGRLPISFPKRIEDTATHGDWYPGRDGTVAYGEGVLVGYRHHDTNGVDPAFGFGHGLGYTSFELGEPAVEGTGPDLTVTVPVTNVGARPGTEVVQLYVHDVEATVLRPAKELKGFAKITLQPGETGDVTIPLDHRSFAFWDSGTGGWSVEPGEFDLLVGTSSRAIRRTVRIALGG